MKTSAQGIAFIKLKEGITLVPKQDSGGYSIGYGHYVSNLSSLPSSISMAQADAYFSQDLATAENAVNQNMTSTALTQQQFDALVDYTYNRGTGAADLPSVNAQLASSGAAAVATTIRTSGLGCGKDGLKVRRNEEAALMTNTASVVGGKYQFPS